MTTLLSFRSVFLLISLLIFSLFPLQTNAQFDPTTGFPKKNPTCFNRGRTSRATMLECSQYNDWQVSVDCPGAPGAETFCSDLGCVGAIARSGANSPKDIFKNISHATDASCSGGVQNVCSITCVGYH